MINYRILQAGEVIQEGDEIYYDDPGYTKWEKVSEKSIGHIAPDPNFLSHRTYRRPIEDRANEL